MFLYPQHALVDRVIPKNKIYGHTQPGRALKHRFVNEVEEIVWRHKLSPGTIHLPARPGVEEIQIFQIALKSGELYEQVLRTIDRAIPSLIFFELTFQGKVRFSAAHKRLSEVGSGQPVVDTYFETPWSDASFPRQPLPVAIDLGSLYEQMLRQIMLSSDLGLNSIRDEPLLEMIERAKRIRVKRRACQKLEVKLKKEIQFNRKVEINAQIRYCKAELAELQRKSVPTR